MPLGYPYKIIKNKKGRKERGRREERKDKLYKIKKPKTIIKRGKRTGRTRL